MAKVSSGLLVKTRKAVAKFSLWQYLGRALSVSSIVLFAIQMFLFNQGDLNHTVISSYGFIEGHFLDFYSFNSIRVGGNDYLPALYLLFAAWMLPARVITLIGNGWDASFISLTPLEIIWAKGLIYLFFALSLVAVGRIARKLFPGDDVRQNVVKASYALSPFAIFAVADFSQYDILGLTFALWGFYFLLNGNKYRFALLFSVAISFKFFALLIFAPLLVIYFKKTKDVLKLSVVAASFTAAQVGIYWNDQAFSGRIFNLVSTKTSGASNAGLLTLVTIIATAGLFILWKKRVGESEQARYGIFTVLTMLALMFSSVVWHPQWFILFTPFLALSLGYVRNVTLFLAFEIIGFLAFIFYTVNVWPNNVDGAMINNGALGGIMPQPKILFSDVYDQSLVQPALLLLKVFFFFPIIFLSAEAVLQRPHKAPRNPTTRDWLLRLASLQLAFTIPALIFAFVPLEVAGKFNEGAYFVDQNKVVVSGKPSSVIGEILDGAILEQTFTTEQNKFSGVEILLATYARTNSGKLTISLIDDATGTLLVGREIRAEELKDNAYVSVPIKKDFGVIGQRIKIRIESDGSSPGNGVTAWLSPASSNSTLKLRVNQNPFPSNLTFNAYYAPE